MSMPRRASKTWPDVPMVTKGTVSFVEEPILIVSAQNPSKACQVDMNTPLTEVTEILKKDLGVPMKSQRLLFGSIDVLHKQNDLEGKTLSAFGIPSGSKIFLIDMRMAYGANSKPDGEESPRRGSKIDSLLSVTVSIRDGQSHTLKLERDGNVCDLKRKLSEVSGIPLPCMQLWCDGMTCSDSQIVRHAEVFEAEDLQLKQLGPFRIMTTSYEDDDFIFPIGSRFTALHPDIGSTAIVYLKREALRGLAADLCDAVAAVAPWPLAFMLSPLSEVTLDDAARANVSIPIAANYFAWMYPASLDWRRVSSTVLRMGLLDVDLLTYGGFMYFDCRFKVVAVNTLGPSAKGGLIFGKPQPMRPQTTAHLWREGRCHRVTRKMLVQLGITHYAWVHKGESLDGFITPRGGFIYLYHRYVNPSPEQATGDVFFPVAGASPMDHFSDLVNFVMTHHDELADDVTIYDDGSPSRTPASKRSVSSFSEAGTPPNGPISDRTPPNGPMGRSSNVEKDGDTTCTLDDVQLLADTPLAYYTQSMKSDWTAIDRAANRIRDRDYKLADFHNDMVTGFPELELYNFQGEELQRLESGRTAQDEYLRTMGALFAVFWLMRLDYDGKEAFCFGVNEKTSEANAAPDADLVEVFSKMSPDQRRINFYRKMCWDKLLHVFVQAGILDADGKKYNVARTKALLALTAIHDIMKVKQYLPTVAEDHGPYLGIESGDVIYDHDIALSYILEHHHDLLPSIEGLDEDSRKLILFTQGSMNFNNGWLVQAEAPPGPLFSSFRDVIRKGSASEEDVAFYFVHWLTDLAGAVPTPYEGMVKFVVQFPDFVLRAFLESFPFVWRLATVDASDVFMDYLLWRWNAMCLGRQMDEFGSHAIAVARLCIGVHEPEKAKKVIDVWEKLGPEDQDLLGREMGMTGIKDEQYKWGATQIVGGPCLFCYYGPALSTKHLYGTRLSFLKIMAEIYRAGRCLFPLVAEQAGDSVTLQVAKIKDIASEAIPGSVNTGHVWILVKRGDKEAVVDKHPICDLVSLASEKRFEVLPLWAGDDYDH